MQHAPTLKLSDVVRSPLLEGEGGWTEMEDQPHAKRAQCSRVSALPARTNAETERRRAIASAVYRPCLRAFLFPFGAPGDIPPCIRHRPFGIAGAWHELRLRVLPAARSQ